jgi:phosphoenolpyruvate-protein kinase (PTS system EI component)
VKNMVQSAHTIRGMAYVPGRASSVLQRGTSIPGGIALVSLQEALEPATTPAAFIVVDGSPLSHAMIELAARAVPTVLIDGEQACLLTPGSRVSVDGSTGFIFIDGGDRLPPKPAPPSPKAGQPLTLRDGTAVSLLASVRHTGQVHQATVCGASGIGLVRSEFLACDAPQPPDVDQWIHEFEAICVAAGRLTVTVRLIDIADDKPPGWLPDAQHLLQPLGMQGSRLYGYEPIRRVVRDQLAALAGLSGGYPIEVLIPFVGRRDELMHWIEYVRRWLPDRVPVGVMAETPAAVLDLANWGDLVDFFSIGTNDLIQFYFAADRDEPALSDILDPYTPALYRLLQQVADAAAEYQEEIRLCGVLPRLSGILPVLIGLGFRHFSVDPIWIPYLAESLYPFSLSDAMDLARRVGNGSDSKEVRDLMLTR